jgi:NAD-dependent DNA ligase
MIWTGCGAKSATEIAGEVDDAIRLTKSEIPKVPEARAESGTRETACDALEVYSSRPAESLTELLSKEAERQRVLAGFGLKDVDPDAADRLADAMEDIENSQKAAEVANALSC